MTRTIAAAVARRFLVLHHLLAPPRSLPADRESVMRVIDRIGSLQFDPIDVAGRNHDLVLLSRIAGYRRAWTDELLYAERRLYETYNKMLSLVPTAELPWYRIVWDRHRRAHEGGTFDEHAPLVEELLARIRDAGPMSSTDVEPRAAIDWYWRPTNQVRAILEALGEAGVLGIARREGNRRVYDLAERLFPPELLDHRPPERDQWLHRLLSRYRAHGLLGATGASELFALTSPTAADRQALRDELVARGAIVPVEVEGIRGVRFVVAAELPLLDQAEQEVGAEARGAAVRPGGSEPGCAFLAPLDPLVWDRRFLRDLHGFDYIWEVYVPPAKRRWGYYVLPVLWGDRLVGRVEPRIERAQRAGRARRTLRLVDVWWEAGFDPLAEPGFVEAFADAVDAHRAFGDADGIVMPRGRRHGPFVRALREVLESRGAPGPRRSARRRVAARAGGASAVDVLDPPRAAVAGAVALADAEVVVPAAPDPDVPVGGRLTV